MILQFQVMTCNKKILDIINYEFMREEILKNYFAGSITKKRNYDRKKIIIKI